jgi:hypothetical protein
MARNASRASTFIPGESHDFNLNYRYLKRLIQELKAENSASIRKEIFGDDEQNRSLTKTEMKQLFRFLRKIEHRYEECQNPPIPVELERSIRSRDESEWLPWEMEAIEKADAWQEELQAKKQCARELFHQTLEKVRKGEKLV